MTTVTEERIVPGIIIPACLLRFVKAYDDSHGFDEFLNGKFVCTYVNYPVGWTVALGVGGLA